MAKFEERAKEIEAERDNLSVDPTALQALEGVAANDLAAAGEASAAAATASARQGCSHVDEKTAALFAHGMCKSCYMDYLNRSGGVMRGAADPPCYSKCVPFFTICCP